MNKKALLIIDVQKGMFLKGNSVYLDHVLLHTLQSLILKARESGVPIFYIQHNAPDGYPLEHGSDGWKLHSDLSPETKDCVIQKTTPDAFHLTDLDKELKNNGIEELILTGIQSEVCVDTTCRRAYSLGYDITLVSDGHSTWSTENLTAAQIISHHNNTLKWFANVKESAMIRL